MLYFRQYPWFGVALLLLGLVLAAEIGGLWERRATARKTELKLERKRRELAKLLATVPAPTIENVTAIAADVDQTGHALSTVEAQLRGSAWPVADTKDQPRLENRADLFFGLADFVEKLRARMTALGIGIEADERFGFSAYANAGPEPGLIPLVQRQHLAIGYLLEALLVARPHRLLAVEREWLSQPAGTRVRDLFTIDPVVSARMKGLIKTDAFRLVFVGQTAALRAFLRQLTGFELPVVVRGIEVESAATAGGATAPRGNEAMPSAAAPGPISAAPTVEAPLPLVLPALSKFTVTVELIEVIAESSNP